MNQIKIGKFIAECRKKKNLTQMQLAEKLNITDRAISKWENGKAMPDSGIMLDLCNELGISVNELLSGEVLEMNNYDKKAEQNLLEMKKQKEEADKRLLTMEFVLGIIALSALLILVVIAQKANIEEWVKLLIIGSSAFFVLVISLFLIKTEQVAGYYECAKCHHKYVPTYSSVCWSMHMGRTRYMKCPECGKKSWQKKVISK